MSQRFRWVDVDLENRPLSYIGDWTTADITAIAWSFIGERDVYCEVQSKRAGSTLRMLRLFRAAWDEADGITGHNVIKHDLRHINGALMEFGLPVLTPKLVCDTYLHLKKKSGISASQENLAAMLGVDAPKVGMNTATWREANRLTPDGIEATRRRVIGDVVQHKALREALLERDLLLPPRVWRP